MYQVVPCKCGETDMCGGRCMGCQVVRPSSIDIMLDIARKNSEISRLLSDLETAVRLEKEND